MSHFDDLIEASNRFKYLMIRSDEITKTTIDTIDSFQNCIDRIKLKMNAYSNATQSCEIKLENIQRCLIKVDSISSLIQNIDQNEKFIAMGPGDQLQEYLDLLSTYYSFENINKMEENNSKLNKIVKLVKKGERILLNEFQNIIKHYSSYELTENFIKFIRNSKRLDEHYMSNETLKKLETIAKWLCARKKSQDLKYNDIRFEFISHVTIWISQKDNLSIKSAQSQPQSTNYLLKTSQSLANLKKPNSTNSLTSLSPFNVLTQFHDTINFFCRLLIHEKSILNRIFDDLMRDNFRHMLVELLLERMQAELELILVSLSQEFKRAGNCGYDVVNEMMIILRKISHFREISDYSKSNRVITQRIGTLITNLHNLNSIILNSYLINVKNGLSNVYLFPSDCGIHEFTESTCKILKILKINEIHIEASLRVLYGIELKRKTNVGKYYWTLIKSLNSFLIEEASHVNTQSSNALINSSKFKNGIGSLRGYVFLLNNLDYILETCDSIGVIQLIELVNDGFKQLIDESITKNCEKAVEIFHEIHIKWFNHSNEDDLNDMDEDCLFKLASSSDSNASLDSMSSFKKLNRAKNKTKSLFNNVKNVVRVSKRYSNVNFSTNPNKESNSQLIKITKKDNYFHESARDSLREQLLVVFRVTTQTILINPVLNSHIKEMIERYIEPILDDLDRAGILQEFAEKLFDKISKKDGNLIKKQIFSEIFPNYKL
jgi:hypothetical protein